MQNAEAAVVGFNAATPGLKFGDLVMVQMTLYQAIHLAAFLYECRNAFNNVNDLDPVWQGLQAALPGLGEGDFNQIFFVTSPGLLGYTDVTPLEQLVAAYQAGNR